MRKMYRFVLSVCVILLVFGAAIGGVGLLTGGSFSRILQTTDIADMTKFFSYEQIQRVVYFLFP